MTDRPLSLAYADPPYPGCAHLYPENAEVDHAELIGRLVLFDGWALSTNETALQSLLPLCPPGVRILAWCKPNAVPYYAHPSLTWEPVILSPARKRPTGLRVASHLVAPVDAGFLGPPNSPFPGRKPRAFCLWLFHALGARAGDTFSDLYPGTGNATDAWRTFQLQPELPPATATGRAQTRVRIVASRLAEAGQLVINHDTSPIHNAKEA